MTLQGRLMTSHLKALKRSLGMMLSRMGLVLIRSGERCSTIKRTLLIVARAELKGLILRREVEDRDKEEMI